MRFTLVLAALATLGCAESGGGNVAAPASKPEYRAVSTLEEFNSQVVGKTLTFEGTNTFTVRDNGTLDGDFDGPLAGNWRWDDGYWCRTLTVPERPEDCQLWETNGTNLRATRAKGTGKSFVYDM